MRARLVLATLSVAVVSVLAPAGTASAQEGGGAEKGPAGHAEEECIKLLEEGKSIDNCQEAPNPILPETNEIVWGGLSFLVLFVLLAKFAYPGLKKGMENRADRIRENLDEAEKAKGDAQQVLDDYQRQLNDAKNESARIIEEARQAADKLRADLKKQAEQEVADLKQRAQDDIGAMVDRARSELQSGVKELTIELTEKVVGRSIDRQANEALIDRFIQEVQAGAPSR